MPIVEVDPAEEPEIPETLLQHLETLNRIFHEEGRDQAIAHREGLGDETAQYPYMVAALIDEGDEVSRFGILKYVAKE